MPSMYPQPDEPDATSADTPSANGPAPDADQPEDDKMAGETALLPKSLLAGKEFKPGDEVVLKIVGLHEDEVEVQYATTKPGEDESPAPDAAGGDGGEMAAAQNRLGSLTGAAA